MAKNLIQFQKGMRIPEFMDNYDIEQKCRDTLYKMILEKQLYGKHNCL